MKWQPLVLIGWTLLTLACITCGLTIGYLLPLKKQGQAASASHSPIAVSSSAAESFVLTVPTESRAVSIQTASDAVRYISWDATDSATITLPTTRTLAQGDTLLVDASGSATLAIDTKTISMQKQSALTLLSTMPTSVITTHKAGVIKYTNSDQTPLEIRIGRAVVTLLSGATTIEQTDTGYVLSGEAVNAKLGYIDTDNDTNIIPIQGNAGVVFNNITRTIIWSRRR